jgi:hypothetical protein
MKWSLDLALKWASCMLSVGRCGKKPYEHLGRMPGRSNTSKRQQKRPSILKKYAAAEAATRDQQYQCPEKEESIP